MLLVFFFSSRRRHTRWTGDWSSDVCSSDLLGAHIEVDQRALQRLRRGGGEQFLHAQLLVPVLAGMGVEEGGGVHLPRRPARSEERRVGKECRSRWSP